MKFFTWLLVSFFIGNFSYAYKYTQKRNFKITEKEVENVSEHFSFLYFNLREEIVLPEDGDNSNLTFEEKVMWEFMKVSLKGAADKIKKITYNHERLSSFITAKFYLYPIEVNYTLKKYPKPSCFSINLKVHYSWGRKFFVWFAETIWGNELAAFDESTSYICLKNNEIQAELTFESDVYWDSKGYDNLRDNFKNNMSLGVIKWRQSVEDLHF